MKIQKKHKQALATWLNGKRGQQETDEMHAALGPYLTESILDAAMSGRLDAIEEILDVEEKPASVEAESLSPGMSAAIEQIVAAAVAKAVAEKGKK